MDQLFDLVIYFYWGLFILIVICFVFLVMFFKIFFPKKRYYNYPVLSDKSDKDDYLEKHYPVFRDEHDPREEYPETTVTPLEEKPMPVSVENDDYPPPRKSISYTNFLFH